MTGTQSLVGGNRTRIRDHSHMPADHESLAGNVERSNRSSGPIVKSASLQRRTCTTRSVVY